MKYEEWLEEWLENYVKLSSKSRTVERYEQIVRQHIVPKLGGYDLEDITSRILQKFVSDLTLRGNLKTGEGLSSNSVNSIINVLQGSIRTAFRLGVVGHCASEKLIRPKCREKQVECFSLQEQYKIVGEVLSANKPYLIGIVICLYTGLRIGELLALTWEDVDLEKGMLSVSKSCHDGKNRFGVYARLIDTPKTFSSLRVIPLPKQLVAILRKHKKRSDCKFVISKNGEGIFMRSYQRYFNRLLQKLEISHHGFHALRHTFATRALECGMDVKTLSEILGHKNAAITLNRYVHSMLDYKKSMMNVVGKSLASAESLKKTDVYDYDRCYHYDADERCKMIYSEKYDNIYKDY